MRRPLLPFAALLLLAAPLPAQEPAVIAPTEARTPADEAKGFRMPPGFEAQLVASEPDIGKPINMAFDAKGRLWVTTSREYPFPARDRPGRDVLYVLDQIGPDGKAGRITKFAEDLNIPIGILPRKDGAIVYTIPEVEHIYDDGTGHAGRREVLYKTFGTRDTHGMVNSLTLGYDGWLYAHHGFSNDSTVAGKDGQKLNMNSGNTWRMRLDGSYCEAFTRGQVNPFGMCFDALGNLYNADCHSRPITQLLRGAYYSSFGKPHDGLGYGPDMIGHDHGSTALCGLNYYAADQFPPQYLDTMFLGNVVTNRINFDKIVFHGSTPQAVLQPDFLVSEDLWFRPVDIKLGPDGALYVADFYNKIIGHYEVPLTHPGRDRERGRIWRIVWKGTDGEAKPPQSPMADFTAAPAEELVRDLAHSNLTVRMLAMHELVDRGDPAKSAVRTQMAPGSKPTQRMHGMWVLERLGALDDTLLSALTHDAEAGVRVHAARLLAERAKLSDEQAQRLIEMLRDSDALVVRCAADALGRHSSQPISGALGALVELRKRVPAQDTHLLHVVRMALRDDFQEAVSGKYGLQLGRDWQIYGDVGLGIPTEGGASLVASAIEASSFQATPELPRQLEHIARYSPARGEEMWKLVLAVRSRGTAYHAELMQAVLRGLQARGAQPQGQTKTYAVGLCNQLFEKTSAPDLKAGIALAQALKEPSLAGSLLKLVADHHCPEAQRTEALTAVAAIDPAHAAGPLARLLTDGGEPVTLREKTAQTLAGLNRPEANAELVKALPTAEARLASAIAAGLAGTSAGAGQLLDAVAAGKASARLLQEQAVLLKLQQSKLQQLRERLAELTKGLSPVDQKVTQLLLKRRDSFRSAKADPALGAKVYTAQCAACHQVGGQGAKVGPQLDGVGIRGLERLLEDILDPNRNVDQAFRATSIELKSGQVLTGLVLREEGEVVVLADAQGKEQRVAKSSIAERTVTPLSPMPANFDQSVSEADMNHLMAYLLTLRPK